jgi:hypothetical protein
VLAEHEQRFRRIVNDYLERPGGDYAALLARGYVSSPEDVDPDVWRDQIRGQARQDKVRVITRRSATGAFAMRNRTVPEEQALAVMPMNRFTRGSRSALRKGSIW